MNHVEITLRSGKKDEIEEASRALRAALSERAIISFPYELEVENVALWHVSVALQEPLDDQWRADVDALFRAIGELWKGWTGDMPNWSDPARWSTTPDAERAMKIARQVSRPGEEE